jgi:acylphosphatase
MINQNSEILNKLFFTELQMLVEKYNKIDEATKKNIESIVDNLKDEELQVYLMSNPNKLLEILQQADEVDEDVVTFFVWYNLEVKPISIHKAKECIGELKSNKYIEIEEYLIYQDERYLKEFARVLLEDRLDQEYYVDKLFEKETIIEMWINRTTKDEMIDEIVDSLNLEETLELYPQEAFSIGGIQYKYAEIEE